MLGGGGGGGGGGGAGGGVVWCYVPMKCFYSALS